MPATCSIYQQLLLATEDEDNNCKLCEMGFSNLHISTKALRIRLFLPESAFGVISPISSSLVKLIQVDLHVLERRKMKGLRNYDATIMNKERDTHRQLHGDLELLHSIPRFINLGPAFPMTLHTTFMIFLSRNDRVPMLVSTDAALNVDAT